VIIAGATSSTYVLDYVSASNVVSCLVTGSGDCPAGETMVTTTVGFIPSAVGQIAATQERWVIVPNPNQGDFTLLGYTDLAGSADFEITDMLGRTVYSGSFVASQNVIRENLRTTNLADGVYSMRISCGGMIRQIRFTIAH
jgi:Secretion system C-terminal sorting domain